MAENNSKSTVEPIAIKIGQQQALAPSAMQHLPHANAATAGQLSVALSLPESLQRICIAVLPSMTSLNETLVAA